MEKLLTKEECAQMLRVSPRTVDSMRAERGLPFLTLPMSRRILFDPEQVRNWLQNVNTENGDGEKEEHRDK